MASSVWSNNVTIHRHVTVSITQLTQLTRLTSVNSLLPSKQMLLNRVISSNRSIHSLSDVIKRITRVGKGFCNDCRKRDVTSRTRPVTSLPSRDVTAGNCAVITRRNWILFRFFSSYGFVILSEMPIQSYEKNLTREIPQNMQIFWGRLPIH